MKKGIFRIERRLKHFVTEAMAPLRQGPSQFSVDNRMIYQIGYRWSHGACCPSFFQQSSCFTFSIHVVLMTEIR